MSPISASDPAAPRSPRPRPDSTHQDTPHTADQAAPPVGLFQPHDESEQPRVAGQYLQEPSAPGQHLKEHLGKPRHRRREVSDGVRRLPRTSPHVCRSVTPGPSTDRAGFRATRAVPRQLRSERVDHVDDLDALGAEPLELGLAVGQRLAEPHSEPRRAVHTHRGQQPSALSEGCFSTRERYRLCAPASDWSPQMRCRHPEVLFGDPLGALGTRRHPGPSAVGAGMSDRGQDLDVVPIMIQCRPGQPIPKAVTPQPISRKCQRSW